MDKVSEMMPGVTSSARNQLPGTIEKITTGAVTTEVVLRIDANTKVEAAVTNASAAELGLKEGGKALALIKSSHLILMKGEGFRLSARNQLWGRVNKIETGAVNTEVQIALADGLEINTVVTNESVEQMALKSGDQVCACAKVSAVFLCVPA